MIFAFLQLFITVIVADIIWFKYSYPKFYQKMFDKINTGKTKYRLLPAIFSWLMLALGIYYFGVMTAGGVVDSFIRGSLFGLISYGIYNGTNYSTIHKYSWKVAMYDTLWGTLLSGFIAVLFKLVTTTHSIPEPSLNQIYEG